ncbi:MAG: hypothetical protein ACXVHB_05890 [Solirubrobacteraceae bacterium]
MLIDATEALQANSVHGASVASGASGQLIAANPLRSGLNVALDPATAGTTPQLYLLLASSGTPSATNFDVAVTATAPWDGMIGPVVWRGAVQYKWAGSAAAGIAVAEV